MIARIRRIAESIGVWNTAAANGEPDEMPEGGVLQFGDGMGLTSMSTYPCGESEAKPPAGQHACAAQLRA